MVLGEDVGLFQTKKGNGKSRLFPRPSNDRLFSGTQKQSLRGLITGSVRKFKRLKKGSFKTFKTLRKFTEKSRVLSAERLLARDEIRILKRLKARKARRARQRQIFRLEKEEQRIVKKGK